MDATDITATIERPSNDELFGSDWNWAEAAATAWLDAAREAGLDARVTSTEVPDLTRDAAIVEVNGAGYLLKVRDDDQVHATDFDLGGTE
jgi:hypothetical protein